VYLTEEFQEELNQAYTKANAQRVMEDKGEIEKHKHFLEAVMRAGLNHDDLDAYIEELLERY
jgi:murein L,D-transpeptidase YcbB/YkuD